MTSRAPRCNRWFGLLTGLVMVATACTPEADQASAEDPQVTGPQADTIRVLAYNIHHGEGMDEVLVL